MAKRKKLSGEDKNTYIGETPPCPRCGTPLTKRYIYSEMYCENCHYGLEEDDDDDDSEAISVYEAADIWLSNGMDEDYMFGYTEKELRKALK